MELVYVEYTFKVNPVVPGNEILIAELGYAGFESFVEQDDGVLAYIQKQDWHNQVLASIQILNNDQFTIDYTLKEIEQQNWNATWEQNFKPIVVDNRCTVMAPFHDCAKTDYTIVIEPKMSFGTGHHATTHMMISLLLEDNIQDKRVLDMGCGTSVLAILAKMRGARTVDAIDIDLWCYQNSLENIARNNCESIAVYQGDASLLEAKKYDLIIANINRNILLADLPAYKDSLNQGGTIYLSGFLEIDLEPITNLCNKLGGMFVHKKQREGWIAAKFVFL